jgi:hypothetical protein
MTLKTRLRVAASTGAAIPALIGGGPSHGMGGDGGKDLDGVEAELPNRLKKMKKLLVDTARTFLEERID